MNTKLLIGIGALVIIAIGWIALSGDTKHDAFSDEDVTYIDTESADEADDSQLDPDNMTDEEFNKAVDSLMTDQNHEITFEHVVPGVYSEVYLKVSGGSPGATIERILKGPGVEGLAQQSSTFDADGEALFIWRINKFGTYIASEPNNTVNPALEGMEDSMVGQVTVQ